MLPQAIFGICGALAAPLLASNPASNVAVSDILLRAPKVFFWVWMNLLCFDLVNQKNPESVLEDRVNKPTRPIPAGRITLAQATHVS